MKRMSFLLVIFFVFIGAPSAQERQKIPLGTAPELDGEAHEEEWIDTATIEFSVQNNVTVHVRMKHDRKHLYLAYYFRDKQDHALIFPELLPDPRNDKAQDWSADDWWFHVSGTDCEARGIFSDYSDCSLDHSDWHGIPNYELSENPPALEQIEIGIALQKLGVTTAQPFGLSLTVEYVPNLRALWPEKAELDSPSTWATVVLDE